MNLNHLNYKQYENNSQCEIFTKCGQINYSFYTFAKSKVQPWKADELYKANSTPNRAFFVRDIRTPKENSGRKNALATILSMVERNRKGFALCRFPCIAVFQPVTFYRPTLESLAVVLEKLKQGLSKMLFKFLCVNRTHQHFNLCTQTIQANNETQARLSLSSDFRYIATVARINRTLSTYFPIVSTSTQGGLANA